jgi:putative membrane protein
VIVWLLLVAVGVVYVAGMRRRWGTGGPHGGTATARAAAFGGGLLVIGAALASPLDERAGDLFSAHMAQHVLLALVAAPLVALGDPLLVLARAVPAGARRALGRLNRMAGSASGRSLLAWWALFFVGFWIWHVPAAYDAAVEHPALHALQHATMFWTALPFWWTVLRRGRRHCWQSVGVLLVTFALDAAGGMAFALAETPIYRAYLETTAQHGSNPVDDVRLGGAFMAMGAMVYLGAAGWLFSRWLARLHEPRAAGAPQPQLARVSPRGTLP